jgi:hypothetical protein
MFISTISYILLNFKENLNLNVLKLLTLDVDKGSIKTEHIIMNGETMEPQLWDLMRLGVFVINQNHS